MQISLKNDRENHSVIQHYIGMSMNQMRHLEVDRIIENHQVHSFLDMGCSEGLLLQKLGRSERISLAIGVDCDETAVVSAAFNTFPENIQQTIQFSREHDQHIYIYKGDATRRYPELKRHNVQLVTMVEVIQHIPPAEIPKVLLNVFGYLQPELCFMSTPNKEFNDFFEFEEGQLRHWDHKFEWTRAEFQQFCEKIKEQYGYSYTLGGVGEHINDPSKGHCTQYALFTRPTNFTLAEELVSENFEEGQVKEDLEERAHYQNKSWRSNLQKNMRNALFKTLYYQTEVTFVEAADFIAKQPIGECLQKDGIVVDRSLILTYLQQNSEDFEWNQQSYRVKQHPEQERENEMEAMEEEASYEQGFIFEESAFSNDLSISKSNIFEKQEPLPLE